ncbi:MAG TPA: hypothetical protein VGS10_01750, partial [Terracidiphilus sp.]|nr:hypothetical protein [Terracidiphilus sp.]
MAAFWQQITPTGPSLPILPACKYCAVYNLRFNSLHGMEEVVGSIPVRGSNDNLEQTRAARNPPIFQIVPIFVPTLLQNGRPVHSNPAQLFPSSVNRLDTLPD